MFLSVSGIVDCGIEDEKIEELHMGELYKSAYGYERVRAAKYHPMQVSIVSIRPGHFF